MSRAEIDALNAAYEAHWRTREIAARPLCAQHSQLFCCLCTPPIQRWERSNKKAKRQRERLAKAKGPTPAMFYGVRAAALRKMGFDSYESYLASALWSRIRSRVFGLDNGQCRLCLADATEIHHTSYDRRTMLGGTLRHLHALCHACHERVEFEETETERRRRTPAAMGREVQAGIQNDRGALAWKLIETRRQGEDLDSAFVSRLSREP
jgi:hypothetical protein